MMDTVKNFLRGIMDIAMVVIPLTVVLGVIFPGMGNVPFIGSDALGEISRLVSSLGSNGLVGIITLGILWALIRR
jgi:sulfite exporter TauE/SafE